MAAVQVRNLHKHYGHVHAVRGIDLSVEAGSVTAVLGPNGAGKTTLLEICEGFRDADSGEVRVLGLDPARDGAAMRTRVGVVLQETASEPYLTAREILTQHAAYYPRARAVDEVLDLVGLTDKAGARAKTLSGGQQRRLDVGLGIIGNPELIFLDEPTTGFDPSARRDAWDLVRGLSGGGTTVVLTTHYIDEAQALADTVVVIANGAIVAQGPPAVLTARRASGATLTFLMPPGFAAGDLPIAATVDASGFARMELNADDELRVVHAVTGWAIEQGVTLADLRVQRASLEDAYLALVDTTDAS